MSADLVDDDAPDAPAGAGVDAPAAARSRRWWARYWPYIVVVVVALAGNALHVARYTVLSPLDESRHVDYMARIYEDGRFVRLGDTLGDTAMRLEACRGTDIPGFEAPACRTKTFDPRDFRDDGYNNAVNNPPLYYLVTGAVAEAVKATGISDNILDPARVMSGIWLAAGLVLALAAGELLGVRRVPMVAAAIAFALAPDPLTLGSTVNADSASVFAGALVLLIAVLWERRRVGLVWVAGAGAVAAALKMTNLIGVGIVAAWFLTAAWVAYRGERQPGVPDRDAAAADRPDGAHEADEADEADDDAGAPPARTAREYLWAVVASVGAAAVVTVGWLAIAGARATIDALDLPSNKQFYEPGFPFRSLVMSQNVFSLFPPLNAPRPPVLDTTFNVTLGNAVGFIVIAVMVSAVLAYRARDRLVTLAAWSGVVLVAAGPGFIASTWFVNRVIFQPVSRYALSAVAVLIVVTAAACKGKVGTAVLWAFALVMAGTVLGTLAFG